MAALPSPPRERGPAGLEQLRPGSGPAVELGSEAWRAPLKRRRGGWAGAPGTGQAALGQEQGLTSLLLS